MTDVNNTNSNEPKKKSLKDLLLLKPVADLNTSLGKVYLYPLRVQDMSHYESVSTSEAIDKIRALIGHIGTMVPVTDEQPERIALEPHITENLSDAEVEGLSDIYLKSSVFRTPRDEQDNKRPERTNGESSASFLDRMISDEIDYYKNSSDRFRKQAFGLTQGAFAFNSLRESTSALGSTIERFNKLQASNKAHQTYPESALINQHLDVYNRMAQESRDRTAERAEEMELTRLTGQMTAESAKALKELLESATIMMEQMEERDKKADKSTQTQIKIAVASVASSAILSLVAAVFAGLSYFQDQDGGVSEDRWRTMLLKSIESGHNQRAVIDQENKALRDLLSSQAAHISNIEKSLQVIEASSQRTKKVQPNLEGKAK